MAKKQKPKRNKKYHPPQSKSKSPLLTEAQFPASEFTLWLAHGVNCLASDYQEALWTPEFESIYNPDGQITLTVEAIRQKVSAPLVDSPSENWTVKQRAMVAWAYQAREVVWAYRKEALRRGGTPKSCDGSSWGMFYEMIYGKAMSHKESA